MDWDMTAKRRRGSFWLLLVLCVAAVGPSGFLHWHNRILPSTWSLTHNMTAQQGLPSSLFYPNNIRLRQNWDFSKGGIVLHVHIPKTGGMTIRDFVYKNDAFRPAVMADSYSGFQRKSPILDSACVNGTRKKRILFFEIHGTDAPSMVKLRDQIHAWRETALANGVAFFAFSSIREPVSLALSHFNFFHSRDPDPRKPRQRGSFKYLDPTPDNLYASMIDNPQCLFLARSLSSWKNPPNDLTWQECETALRTWVQDFDWVGTTDQLSTVTIPFLQQLANQLVAPQKRNQPRQAAAVFHNRSPNHLARDALNETMIRQIRERTAWDQKLYNRVQMEFSVEDLVLS